MKKTHHNLLCFFLALGIWLEGCDEVPNQPTLIYPGEVTDTADSNDTDAALHEDPLNDDTNLDDITEPIRCPAAENLGVLKPGNSRTISGPFSKIRTQNANTTTECFENTPPTDQKQFAFQVSAPSLIEFTVLSEPETTTAFALYKDDCSPQDALFCHTASARTALVEPGPTYILQIDALTTNNAPTYQLTYQLEEAACLPGVPSCENGHFQECIQGRETRAYACANQRCDDALACAGDHCEQAIDILLTEQTPTVTVNGHRRAYTHQWDAAGRENCALYGTGPGEATPGGELFFRLPALKEGKTLTIDASTLGGDFGFFILDDCNANRCHATGAYDDELVPRMHWLVPADGDYLAVIEALGASSRPWEYTFTLE